MVQNNQNRANAIDSYYSNPNNATANAIANTNDYTPINARTLLQSIGLLPVDSNAITPTNPTPNNNLFSNIDEVFSFIDGTISRNRAENDYTIGKTREQMLWTDKAQRDRAIFDKDLDYKDTVRSDKLQRSRAIFDKDLAYKDNVRGDKLERDRLSWDAKQEADKARREAWNKQMADIWTSSKESQAKQLERLRTSNQDYKDQVHLQRTRELELDRTRIDNENERNKHRNEMEKNEALYRNNIDVTRINADAQLGVARTNADAQLGVARTNADAQLGVARLNTDAQLGVARTNADAQKDVARTNADAQLGVARTNADAQLGATRINADAQLGATRINADTQKEVARMNNEYGMQTTLLQGSQRQAELDKQGLIQLQLANADRGQRGYDNMYSMLNQYTNRPRSNFAYWG